MAHSSTHSQNCGRCWQDAETRSAHSDANSYTNQPPHHRTRAPLLLSRPMEKEAAEYQAPRFSFSAGQRGCGVPPPHVGTIYRHRVFSFWCIAPTKKPTGGDRAAVIFPRSLCFDNWCKPLLRSGIGVVHFGHCCTRVFLTFCSRIRFFFTL